MNQAALHPGYSDPVDQAQLCFRAVLQALARPGSVHALSALPPSVALSDALRHLLLTLTDNTTAVWWQNPNEAAQAWLRFHTSAPVATEPQQARFAVIDEPLRMPHLSQFAQGTDAAPEESTTLLVELPQWSTETALWATGPGINGRTALPSAMPNTFWEDWNAQATHFPCGVDVVFACHTEIMGLPRTTRLAPPLET